VPPQERSERDRAKPQSRSCPPQPGQRSKAGFSSHRLIMTAVKRPLGGRVLHDEASDRPRGTPDPHFTCGTLLASRAHSADAVMPAPFPLCRLSLCATSRDAGRGLVVARGADVFA
jgi:hypothetical protein